MIREVVLIRKFHEINLFRFVNKFRFVERFVEVTQSLLFPQMKFPQDSIHYQYHTAHQPITGSQLYRHQHLSPQCWLHLNTMFRDTARTWMSTSE